MGSDSIIFASGNSEKIEKRSESAPRFRSKNVDVALVYKHEKVDNGTINTSDDAIGGTDRRIQRNRYLLAAEVRHKAGQDLVTGRTLPPVPAPGTTHRFSGTGIPPTARGRILKPGGNRTRKSPSRGRLHPAFAPPRSRATRPACESHSGNSVTAGVVFCYA